MYTFTFRLNNFIFYLKEKCINVIYINACNGKKWLNLENSYKISRDVYKVSI